MGSIAVELMAKIANLKQKEDYLPLADLITSLGEHNFTSQELASSGLSKAVYKLRKHANHGVSEAAKAMVEKWTQMLQAGAGATALPAKLGTAPKAEPEAKVEPQAEPKAEPAPSSGAAAAVKPEHAALGKMPGVKSQIDPGAPDSNIRTSALSKFGDIFAKVVATPAVYGLSPDEVDGVEPASLAAEIETAMHSKLGPGTSTGYKNKLRSLLFNLKDAKNTELVTRIVCGSLMPERLVAMDPKDMASSETKKWREQVAEYKKMELMDKLTYQRYAYKDRELPDGLFECPKCRSKKTEYSEKQTRSADEPTTKFCHCTSCDYRWKFC